MCVGGGGGGGGWGGGGDGSCGGGGGGRVPSNSPNKRTRRVSRAQVAILIAGASFFFRQKLMWCLVKMSE